MQKKDTYHSRYGELTCGELFREPIDLAPAVAEYNCLCDGHCLIQVGKRIKLPFFLLNGCS